MKSVRNSYLALPHQQGVALMVMMVILILGSATLLVSSLSRISTQIEKNANDINLLAQAKDIVLGYAAGGTDVGVMFSPDRLITPTEVTDSVSGPPNYDGDRDGCQSNDTCLGRFPWKSFKMSLGAPSDHDPTGVMPWYALSGNMNAPDAIPFNSDILTTPFHPWLTVRDMNGNIISSRVAIILLLPGPPLANQSRTQSPNLGGPNQYLDRITVPTNCSSPCTPGVTYQNDDLDNDFIMGDAQRWIVDPSDSTKQISDPTYQFNDKLIYITIDELMPLIEKRVGNQARAMLKQYYAAWGGYPFATTFSNPATSSLIGSSNTYRGLLPSASAFNFSVFPVWRSSSFSFSFTGGTVSNQALAMKSGTKTNSSWRYENMSISGTPTITIRGTLDNIGFGLWPPYDYTTTQAQVTARVGGVYKPAASVMDNVSVTGVLQSDGSAIVTFKGTVRSGNIPDRIRFTDVRPCDNSASTTYCPNTSTTWPSWFGDNEWYRMMYYAVSQQYAPGGNHTCTTSPCLTVNGQGGGGSKKAIIATMSNRLTSQSALSSGNVAKYLEGENATPSDLIYENNTRSATFNDQVIFVEP
ncbi:MAG: hypothetical protein PXX77_06180 [Gallionella sp.]|nr:hypothetical protein [Gallionella sp.]